MFGKQDADVLVVGAGPVGLYTALRLADSGIRVRVLDRHHRTGLHSYGLALHARSLELLQGVGLTERLLAFGRRITHLALHEGGQRRLELPLGGDGGPFPFVLVVPQSLLESELENRLRRHRIKVQWNQRMESLRPEGERMIAEVSHLDRVAAGYPVARSEWAVVKTTRVRSSYVVGADGYHSHVREMLGLGYPPHSPQHTYAVFEFDAEDETDELVVVFDGGRIAVRWPMRSPRARWTFEIRSADEYVPTREGLNRLIRERAPGFPETRSEVIWASVVQFDRRLAQGLGRDRVWIVGDAAHLTTPAGVQSLNAGLIDGEELAWRLIEVLARGRSAETLATYGTERLVELTPLFGAPGALPAPESAEPWARDAWPDIVAALPATGPELRGLLARLGHAVHAPA